MPLLSASPVASASRISAIASPGRSPGSRSNPLVYGAYGVSSGCAGS